MSIRWQEIPLECPVGDLAPQVGAGLVGAAVVDAGPDTGLDNFFRQIIGVGIVPC